MAETKSVFAGLPDYLPGDKQGDEPPKEELPEELKGKSPQEVFKTVREKYFEELNAYKQKMGEQGSAGEPQAGQSPVETPPIQTPPVQNQPNIPVSPIPPTEEEAVDFFSNPDQYLDAQLKKRLGPLVETFANAQRTLGKDRIRQQIKEKEGSDELYKKYEPEMDKFVSQLAPQVQADPRAYEVAFNYVRSLHFEDEVESKAKKIAQDVLKEMGVTPPEPEAPPKPTNYFGTGNVPVTPPGQPRTKPKPTAKLTPEQEKVANAMGMTAEEYVEWGKFNTDIVSELGRREQ